MIMSILAAVGPSFMFIVSTIAMYTLAGVGLGMGFLAVKLGTEAYQQRNINEKGRSMYAKFKSCWSRGDSMRAGAGVVVTNS